jgi:hypothetical protein
MKKLLVITFLIFMPMLLLAEWSETPFSTTKYSFEKDTSMTAVMAVDHDGNYYMMYFVFQSYAENFACYLHKLDKNGDKLWGDRGLLISDHHFDTWLSQSSIIVDDDNNIVLAFEDARYDPDNPEAARILNMYKISPDGEFLWGEDGVQVASMDGIAFLGPQVIQTTTGDYMTVCTKLAAEEDVANLALFKVNKDGQVQGEAIIIHDYDSETKWTDIWPSIHPVEDGSFIMFWNAIEEADQDTTIGGWGTRKFFAQKYDTDLNQIWENDLIVIDPPVQFAFRLDHTVKVEPDNNNGFFIGWYDNREFDANVRLNHLHSDGTLLFDSDGLAIAAPKEGCSNLLPILNYDEELGSVFIFWIEECIKISYRGTRYPEYAVYTNRFTKGNDTWDLTDEGYATMPQECYFNPMLYHASSMGSGNQMLFFVNGDNSFEAAMIDQNGQEKGYVLLSEPDIADKEARLLDEKMDILVTDLVNDQWVACWIDHYEIDSQYGPEHFFMLYAQNLNIDGSLGPKTTGVIENNIPTETSGILYPNPVSNEVNIELDDMIMDNFTVLLYTADGRYLGEQVVKVDTANSASFKIDELSKGAYIIRIYNGSDVKTMKFIK